ncbi:conserved hypothetical protein [Aspergillus terreus NIH2624]|uniref:Store-operated calcium entry-associated regulatory factor n=1 Tax=Aspergillus terreus (strain NIH 2624 / FGSC A1156) TaxID=341663 RepID=Q0CH32_ASPTN|nr:uncharacterized protein ATEG_07010 [Aspergillus terreus NIH2624]EAU32394.1 conserved hypothetical protein [Aspergillus terreus NIH2624]
MKPLIHLQLFLTLILLSSPAFSYNRAFERPPGKNAILLSKVQTLTLRANRLTSSRRVSPIPQLKCTGPSKRICDMYPIDTMRCTNAGYDYDEEDVQWTCTASLPAEFKLGATDVVCEGYRDADDPWVLKGSCGVEYRLLLTELGEKKFGRVREDSWLNDGALASRGRNVMALLGDLIFFGFFVACFLLIMWPMLRQCFGLRWDGGERRFRGWGRWDGGGGGGGGGPFYPPGPPPPYNSCNDNASTWSRPGWTPGFWTGALGGAAAGQLKVGLPVFNPVNQHWVRLNQTQVIGKVDETLDPIGLTHEQAIV